MRAIKQLPIWLVCLLFTPAAFSQPSNRINYNNQQLFLSGVNLPWVSYSHDIGMGKIDTATIGDWMIQVHQHGGNAVRWWLHTDGQASPVFDTSRHVTGPGTTTIAEIRKVLDLAWEREISVQLCLWSFGMLNNSLGADTLARNKLLLTDTAYTNAYIRNCLIPMVEALKGHPAINSWEIFNEPEGMATQYLGFGAQQLISMSYIQRVINLCAGAIHRTDPAAQVTSGAWSFYALSDQPLAKSAHELSKISSTQKAEIASFYHDKYGSTLSADEIIFRLQKIAVTVSKNWYRDDRLIAEGGDLQGTLDFYSVHYYSTSTPTSTSPFVNAASSWGLDKPIVVGEFPMESGKGAPNIPTASIYDTLYQLGYAGALAWSWSEEAFSTHAHMNAGMQSLWDKYQTDVDLLGTGGDWPTVSITSPLEGDKFPDSTDVVIEITADDVGAAIDSIEIFVSDTVKIAVLKAAPYTFTWTNITDGIYKLKAVATNSLGRQQKSSLVQITVGTPPMKRLEAETAVRRGSAVTVVVDVTASGRKYVDIKTSDTTATITWKLTSVPAAGSYPITFGYRLAYESPKSQFININGERYGEVEFTAPVITGWYEKTFNVDLVKDTNTIQMQASWGYMHVDYLAVPIGIMPTTGVNGPGILIPVEFSLQQNYPNPFNPATTINFSLPKASRVKLIVYNILGQNVATLLDEYMSAGKQSRVFDAGKFSSGVYFYRLDAGIYSSTKKMLLLK